VRRYGYRAAKDELERGNELDGYMIMLSSDTCLQEGPQFLEAPLYDPPRDDMTSFVVERSDR
jgi:hypothetical protein